MGGVAFGKNYMSLFVIGAIFGEIYVLLFVQVLRAVHVLFFVSGIASSAICNYSKGGKCCNFEYKLLLVSM